MNTAYYLFAGSTIFVLLFLFTNATFLQSWCLSLLSIVLYVIAQFFIEQKGKK